MPLTAVTVVSQPVSVVEGATHKKAPKRVPVNVRTLALCVYLSSIPQLGRQPEQGLYHLLSGSQARGSHLGSQGFGLFRRASQLITSMRIATWRHAR